MRVYSNLSEDHRGFYSSAASKQRLDITNGREETWVEDKYTGTVAKGHVH